VVSSSTKVASGGIAAGYKRKRMLTRFHVEKSPPSSTEDEDLKFIGDIHQNRGGGGKRKGGRYCEKKGMSSTFL